VVTIASGKGNIANRMEIKPLRSVTNRQHMESKKWQTANIGNSGNSSNLVTVVAYVSNNKVWSDLRKNVSCAKGR
jgi:hypothetical protein